MFSMNLKRLALILVFPVAGIVTLTALPNKKVAAQIPEAVESSPSSEKAPIRDKAAVRFKSPTKLSEALSEVRNQGMSA